jgi:hypothetical protein
MPKRLPLVVSPGRQVVANRTRYFSSIIVIALILNDPLVKMPSCMPEHRHHNGEAGKEG